MSAVNEISHIQDEDLLKKMWQDTEDFGKKKEIRAHMYKLREERLKDLYCSSDITTNKKSSFNHSMHTDALADHSFASLKRKEIRDSESPTKDNSYIIKGRSSNDGWNVSKIEEHSEDGKRHKFSQSAHRSGSEYIPHGRIDYEAKNNQEVISFQDGTDKNFIKSKGTSSNSFITQEAVGGDGNSFVRSSTTKSSASSRTVTEQKSTHDDAIDYSKQLKIEIVNDGNRNNSTSSENVTHKNTLVANVGNYQQKGFHHETMGRNVRDDIQSSSNTTKTTTEQKSSDTYVKQLHIPDDIVVDRTTRVYTTDAPRELKTHPGYVEGKTKITRETKTLADGTVVTTTKYETKGVDETRSSSSLNQYVNSSSSFHDNISNKIKSNIHDEKFQTQKVIHDKVPKTQSASKYYVEKTHIIPDTTDNIQFDVQSRRDSTISEKRTDSIKNQQSHVEQKYEINTEERTQNKSTSKNTETDRKQTVHHVNLSNDSNLRKEETIKKEVVDKNEVLQKTIATHDVNSVPLRTPIEIEINLTRMSDYQENECITKKKEIPKSESPSYDIPKKRDSIKHESEMTTKTKKTDGQYDTTYRTDYTNKKISIEVSPTHDAFARSLRAVSPDRLSSRTSSRNLKNSTSSLRSSSSPEKTNLDRRLSQRVSPDRYTNGRCYSPSKKLPEKFSSTETITLRKTPPQRMSPEKIQKRKHSTEIKSTTIHSTKITKKNEEKTRDQQSPTKNKPRSSNPDDTQRYTNVYEITTDLDNKTSTTSHSTIATDTVKSKVDSETTKQFFIHDQKRHSNIDSRTTEPLKKDRPIDRPLKRSDTYEERCRQILGITSDSNEKRKNSLEKIRKKGSALSLPVESQPKTPQEKSEESILPKKVSESPRQKSPTKPLQEYPAQKRSSSESPVKETVSAEIRKSSVGGSPGKDYSSPRRHYPDEQSSLSRNSPKNHPHRKPSSDSHIQEFPSQILKTAETYSPSEDPSPRKNILRTFDSHKKETSPSTQESPGEYPQNGTSPNKRSPSRSSPKQTKQDEKYHINLRSTKKITNTQTNEQRDKVYTEKHHLEENIYENSGSETIQSRGTVKIDENISNTEDYGDTRKTPEKIVKRANVEDDEKSSTTNTVSAKIENDYSCSTTVKDTRKMRNNNETTTSVSEKQKPPKHKAESDSSSEEIVETQSSETIIYDIPRTTPVDTPDIEKIIKKRIDDHEILQVNITNTKSLDEDKQTIKNHNVETSVNCEITDIYRRKSPHVDETEEPKSLSKHAPSTVENSPSTRKSLKKSTSDDNPDKNSQKSTRTNDSLMIEHVETSVDIRTDAKETTSTVKISDPKDIVNSSKSQNPVAVATGRPTQKIYPGKTRTSKEDISNTTRNTNEIEITTKLIKSEADDRNRKTSIISEPSKVQPYEIRKTSDKNKPYVDDKESLKPKNIIEKGHSEKSRQDVQTSRQLKREKNIEETTEFDTSITILSSIEQRKQFPSNQGSEHQLPSKITDTTNESTDDSNRSTHNEKDLRGSLGNLENSIHIGIEETIIIESDEELSEEKNHQSDTLKRYIHIEDNRVQGKLEEFENELNEIEFATIKRKPNKQSIFNEQPSNKKVPQLSTTQKYNKNIKTNVDNEQKNVSSARDITKQVLVKKTERVPSEQDNKKQTQRTSRLSKKITTQKRLDIGIIETLKDNSIVKKTQVQKQVKPDTVKQKEASKQISSKYNRQQIEKTPREISKKLSEKSLVLNSGVGEDIHTKIHVMETYEGKTPVEEPFLTKKTVSLLYSDDEDEKKTTQMFIESEIIETQPIVTEKNYKTVKSPKTTTSNLINTEKAQNNVQKPKSLVNPSTKLTKNILTHSRFDKKKPNYQQPTKKTLTQTPNTPKTLEYIEILENETGNQIHSPTNRVDETINEKKSTSLVDKSTRNDSIVPKTSDQGTPKRPSSRNITITNNKNKTQKPKKLQQNPAKSAIPQKQMKSEFEITKTTNIRTTTTPKPKTISKRIEEPVDSDEESLPDSLNESVINSSMDDFTAITKTRAPKITDKVICNENEIVSENSHEKLSSKTSVITPQDKPKNLRPIPGKTKKYLTRKEIDTERVTIDLQRSISSREATPDKVFPHPVTSDDEEAIPRYPDKVVEPDDGTPRKNYDRLFDTSIHEYSDSIQSKKIIEIDENTNQGVSRINRVDNDDESLMTVNKKINKFLSTAEKLTEKPIVDISQPAPKVQRPKFEVNDDLKEDDCLLSVSDKVQKFITEAEYLTMSKDTQHRESINIDVKSDVSDKINQFTSPQIRNYNTTPRKSVTSEDISYSPPIREIEYPDKKQPITITSIDKNKLDQDVFITTECAEIEKESDMFRTSKQSFKPSNEEPTQPQQKTFSDSESPTTAKKLMAPNETSRQREEVRNSDTIFDDTPSKSRKNSLKEFTPKTRRPSQEEKVILSSVSRLRTNESIKKAKAIFDNAESSTRDERMHNDILNRPSVFEGRNRTSKEVNTKRVIDRNNVTPKRLDFTSEKNHDEVVRQESTHNLENQVPSYMKPLNRNTKPKDHPSVPHGNLSEPHQPNKNVPDHHDDEQKTVKELNVPGYMKPLDRFHQHTQDSCTLNNQEHTKHSQHKSNIASDDTPGYMKPIDRSHQHNHEITSTIHDTHEHSYIERHSVDENHSHYTNDDNIPGYMKPLDRSGYHHPGAYPATEAHRHIISGSDSHKHYTSSIDHENVPRKSRTSEQIHRNSTTTDCRYESRTTKDNTPRCLEARPDRPSSKYPKHDYEDDGDLPGYMQPIDRSPRPQFDRRETSKSPDRYNQPKKSDGAGDGDIPHYMKPLDRSVTQYESGDRSRSSETDKISSHHPKSSGDQHGYMQPVDRSTDHRRNNSKSPERALKDQKPRFGSPQKYISAGEIPKEIPVTKNKFGVILKRTNSGKAVLTSKTEKTHPLLLKKQITEEEIEDIYDLEVLEELLLKYTVYEIRRKIRSQIRIVKKLISEGKLEITIKNLRSKNRLTEDLSNSERKDVKENDNVEKSISRTKIEENINSNRTEIMRKKSYEFSEQNFSTSRKESFSSTRTTERLESRRSVSPEKKNPETNRSTPERSSIERRYPPKQYADRNIIAEEKSSYQTSHPNKGATTNVVKSNLKKTEPKAKKPTSTAQPEWITQRNLKKIGTNQVVKKFTVSSSATNKQSTKLRDSEMTECTDLIASSYGIGPTDENGAPLFGLRALRAQNSNGTSKVQGTVISSEYYSETGKEPVGKISVTKYSSDPRDLGSHDDLTQNGDILSVTTTQKYGYENTPSLEQLTTTEKEICDSRTDRRKGSSNISTIKRKNSVKALTQKFVENAVEETKNERQTSYPKAGLILRSSSFKKETETGDMSNGEQSVEERVENSVSVKSSKSISGDTFLKNKSKVTGVQDAISRMKAKDVDYGDAEENIEARDLLNKYLGSQVILSGMEKHVSTGSATSTSSFTSAAKSTSRITTVAIENGKEVTRTRNFEHPVSAEVLDTVWDEQTLRYLLEQSTDYEERKRIRARLRVIMAEQEACTELVKQASQDQSSQSIDEKIETSKEVVTEGPITTTKVTRVSTQQHVSKKPMSPFAKFRQLDKQNSLNTPPSTPRTPGGSPIFKFTDAALSQSASTIKDRLLYWCRMKTKEYENIQLDNFSSSWADGLAFCALIHHFLPDAFDYHALTPKERRHNFSLAFKVADEKADIAPLLDVDDMVATMRPDWKCVFTYVQSIYRRFKDED